jgi:23S rRNA pseudouridine1911/1915/1917 synthase
MRTLWADNRIFVCIKEPGILSTDEPGGLPEQIRRELGDEKACVRTVHRLDQVVGGVMVLSRSRRAAQLLSEQMRCGGFEKEYLAVTEGLPAPEAGEMRDLLLRERTQRRTVVTDTPGKDARPARLTYRVLSKREGMALIAVRLGTGRTHQIRCQFASRGLPLLGDGKYGSRIKTKSLCLFCRSLSFYDSVEKTEVAFTADPPAEEPWTVFSTVL